MSLYSPNIRPANPEAALSGWTPGWGKPPAVYPPNYSVSVAGNWPVPYSHGAPSRPPYTAQNYVTQFLGVNIGWWALGLGALALGYLILSKR